MVVTPIEQAKFVPVDPKRPALAAIAVLSGDPTSGPSTMLLRMARGPGRLHVHTADYRLVIVRGTMKHWSATLPEAAAPELGPGSSWFQPGGDPHGDSCLTDECLMYIAWSGARDGRLAEAAEAVTAPAVPPHESGEEALVLLESAFRAASPAGITWMFERRPELTHATIYRSLAPVVLRRLFAPSEVKP